MSDHAGDLSPEQAWRLLREDPRAVLVDVRTHAEWAYVGVPDLSPLGKDVVLAEWVRYPDGERSPDFLDQLRRQGVGDGAPVLLLCRSGARSAAAAELLTAAGLGPAYNVADGFEGPLDGQGHRAVAGWRQAGLPWRQS